MDLGDSFNLMLTDQLVDPQLRRVELEDIFLLVQRFDSELQHLEKKYHNTILVD